MSNDRTNKQEDNQVKLIRTIRREGKQDRGQESTQRDTWGWTLQNKTGNNNQTMTQTQLVPRSNQKHSVLLLGSLQEVVRRFH